MSCALEFKCFHHKKVHMLKRGTYLFSSFALSGPNGAEGLMPPTYKTLVS